MEAGLPAKPGGTNAPSAQGHVPIEFAQLVQDALSHLAHTAHLQTHLLAELVRREHTDHGAAHAGHALRQRLTHAVELLRPTPSHVEAGERAWRPYQLLKLRYVDGLEPTAVQAQLGIGKSQYYLEHTRALRAVVSVLWEQWQHRDDQSPTAEVEEVRPEAAVGSEPRGIPAQLGALIGREIELAAIDDQLLNREVRLLTLTGPPGIGKTRLAIQAARRLQANFGDGAVLVDLADIPDAWLVLPAIERALGLVEIADARPDRLRQYLVPRHMLLVLDTFEHVLDAGPAVANLVMASPRLRVIIASRAALNVYGEVELVVPPLLVPDVRTSTPDDLLRGEAVRLFIERARAVRPGFQPRGADVRAIVEICARLDGLPLAIELAAARVRVLSPAAILRRLERRLDLLVVGARDAPARHQTLRATFDWSYALLEPTEQAAFRRLAVFVGGCRLDAASAVLDLQAPSATLDVLQSLVAKSLVAQMSDVDDEPRFLMLQTLHEYARERLDESGDSDAVQQRHTAFFLDLAERARPALSGSDQEFWLRRLEQAHENLRSALERFINRGDAARALRMCAALWRFWSARGHLAEGRHWISQALSLNPRGTAQPDVRDAHLSVLHGGAVLAQQQADLAAARALDEQALELARAVGEPTRLAEILIGLGSTCVLERELDAARPLLQEARARHAAAGDRGGEAWATLWLARAASQSGQVAEAEALATDSAAGLTATGDLGGAAEALLLAGRIALNRAERLTARRHLQEALRLFRSLGDRRGVAMTLESWAGLRNAEGQPEAAVRLAGAAAAVRDSIGAPATADDGEWLDMALASARQRLTGTAWTEAWSAGAGEPLEELLERELGVAASQ